MAKSEDDILEQYLAGKSDISKQYQKSEQPDIPKKIDDVILSLAKFSVAANESQNRNIGFFQKWQMPLSIAAVFVISASLVFTLYDEYGQSYLDSPSSRSTQIDQEANVQPLNVEAVNKNESIDDQVREQESLDDEQVPVSSSETAQSYSSELYDKGSTPVPKDNRSIEQDTAEQEYDLVDEFVPEPQDEVFSISKKQSSEKPEITTFVLSDSLDQGILNKEKVKVLSNEIEELRRAKAQLAEEQKALKENLEKNTSKQTELQQQLLDTSDIESLGKTSSELQEINQLWKRGNKVEAKDKLIQFLENKRITIEKLNGFIPKELIEEVSNEIHN